MRKRYVGFYGCPPLEAIREACERTSSVPLDLDGDFGHPSAGILPATSCRIIRNIADNALFLKEELSCVVAAVGEDKCDAGRFLARILEEKGLEVFPVENKNRVRRKIVLATARMPLKEKMLAIMETVHTPFEGKAEFCEPSVAFWGVLPHDLRLLELFPDTTWVYGWTRCVEAGVPSDLSLEMEVDPRVKTIFFTQSFCAKQTLAKHLCEKHGGLLVDSDGPISHSLIAKVEAFLRFGNK
ncbi:MAG TPA: hypothetical protein DD435_08105 [Cyanobacteria bacterium UBA8530]|nr:hypothetical protein [Cyanobacteria bacterium UBA8530]